MKFLRLLPALVLLFFLVSCGAGQNEMLSFGGEAGEASYVPPGPVLMEDPFVSNPGLFNHTKMKKDPVFGSQTLKREQICSITFLPDTSGASEERWDVSYYQDNSVLAWVERNGELYDLYLAADGGVIAPANCAGMFCGYVNLERIDFNSAFDTSYTTNMSGLFAVCGKLKTLDLSGFDTSSVTIMYGMFMECGSLTSLDLSSFDTSNVTHMGAMFWKCSSLMLLDLSSFNTSNVISMEGMFSGCSSLISLDLSSFDTSNVISMSMMFEECRSLPALDLSSFRTPNVIYMIRMFYNCKSLQSLDISGFAPVTDLKNKDKKDMITGCNSLTKVTTPDSWKQ